MQIKYKDYLLKIETDDDPMNPRDDDNFGTMVCFHKRYVLGDKHEYKHPDECIDLESRADVVFLPLYLFDHSGISINTKPFNCPWDSGRVGLIYITHEDILKNYEEAEITDALIERAKDLMNSEVQTYNAFLVGEVYGYIVEHDGEELDSCWGYYSTDDAIAEAKGAADYDERRRFPLLALAGLLGTDVTHVVES
jgi:hypothetical protein